MTPAPAARHRLVAVVLLLAGWLGLGLLGTATPAAAHAELVSSEPAAGARLEASPGRLTLRFSEGVSLITGGIRLLGSDASAHPVGAPTTSGTEVAVPVGGTLPDGSYILVYRVVSADTHPVTGSVPFTVGTAAPGAPTAGLDALVAQQTAVSDVVRGLWAVDRWAGFAGVVVLLGVPAFVVLCWPAGAADPALRRLTLGGGAVVLLTAAAGLPLQAAYATGAGLGASFSDGSIPDLLSRSAGQAAAGRVALAAAFLVLLARAARRGSRGPAVAAGLAAAGILLSYSWAGHPAVAEYPALTMADDSLHLAAASVWVGGLVCLAVRLLSRPVPALAEVLGRWSAVAMGAVAVLVVTGSVQAWRELRSVPALVETAYGRWVLAKILGLVLLVALGWYARRRVRRYVREHAGRPGRPVSTERVGASVGAMLADPPPDELRPLRRSVAAEVAISAAVLAATAVLVVTTPGRAQIVADAGENHQHQGQHTSAAPGAPPPPAVAGVELPNAVKVEVSVDPPLAGTPTIAITVRDLVGAAVDPPEVVASADLASAGIAGLPLQLTRTEPGRFTAEGARLPFPGEWRITVTVRTTDVDSGVGTVSVHIQ